MHGHSYYGGDRHDPNAYYGPTSAECDKEIAYLEHRIAWQTRQLRDTIKQYKKWRSDAVAAGV